MLSCYSKEDLPPNRVKPVPIQVIRRIFAVAATLHHDPQHQCLADMIGMAFFFLLRPGEYAHSPSDSSPFQLRDVQLFRGALRLNLATATDAELFTATFTLLTFRDQKNDVRGEVVGLGHSSNPFLSPPRILARRILHLRSHGSLPTTPLCSYYIAPQLCLIPPREIIGLPTH
uniref:Uncharacterized protein n=1 Tax=Chaetoceros debilis TaxID=122233 RepID=A0A6S8Z5K5_9STRA|mmetsp:Transcript_1635/g.2338  ORF Transcript_1635/g.2338 Transcript_1635/m.2338 type:complete len:173 (-) Transcript_1635:177-695(-)